MRIHHSAICVVLKFKPHNMVIHKTLVTLGFQIEVDSIIRTAKIFGRMLDQPTTLLILILINDKGLGLQDPDHLNKIQKKITP